NGATLRLNGGTVSFATNVVVNAGAQWEVTQSTTVQVGGVVTNRGTLRWISSNNTFNLQGAGRIENEGLWEIFQDPAANNRPESVVAMPVNVPVGGKLLLSKIGRASCRERGWMEEEGRGV